MKTVLITGSNKGIGFETARQYGQAGFRVILSGRNADALEKARDLLVKENMTVDPLLMDVSNDMSIREAAAKIRQLGNTIDVLINNAGILPKNDHALHSDDEKILQEIVETNCYGPLRVCKHFLPLLSSPARIIMISSQGGSMSEPVGGWSPAYCVSKTMLNGITRQLAYELKEKHIAVNAVCPGWVKTDMGGKHAPRSVEQGAATQLWLGTEAGQKITGKFFMDKKEIDW
jgi:NAD(P)-dependent dehydrogenase (short-subunit alcohol dehydrogenase family)